MAGTIACRAAWLALMGLHLLFAVVSAQELEPGAYAVSPVGINVLVAHAAS